MRAPQALVAGKTVTGAAASPYESVMGSRTQLVEVSVTVNVTLSGAGPEVGVAETDPLVALVEVLVPHRPSACAAGVQVVPVPVPVVPVAVPPQRPSA